MKEVLLYTRKQCPLCDEARALLELFDVNIIEHDIETRDEWQLNYGLMIPVIVIDREEMYGEQISFEQLNKRLSS
ncbi:glutaredoxin family protein [Aciduricibacillus chroicocephali]|uniref:Glutaredoxin family protein n=1 Tax=Aciduricibacillus chroicocephali TaxID=3054939 RepID=A0ABY9KSY2_9BACI|nr:glutaredoxin family protein [Bacillaceae bacterium 44XB]